MKAAKILSYVICGIEVVVLINIAYMTLNQKAVLSAVAAPLHLEETLIPYTVILTEGILFLLYVALTAALHWGKEWNPALVGSVLTGLGCGVRILMTYGGTIVLRLCAMKGAEYLAAYSSLTNVIQMTVSPLSLVAFALFCMTCGMYMMCGSRVQ